MTQKERPESLSETATAELRRRIGQMLPSMLGGQAGAIWLAATSALSVSQTFVAPESFEPCALALSYGTEVSAIVTFVKTGEQTITASAMFVRAESIANDWLQQDELLPWELAE